MIKLCLLGIIIATQLVSVFVDKNTPYFPIEISRTASGTNANLIFLFGVVALIIPIITREAYSFIPIWIGIVFLAYFDDVSHWFLHNLGVLIMVAGIIVQPTLNIHTGKIFLLGVMVFIFRLFIRFIVLAHVEFNYGLLEITNPFTIKIIAQKSIDIMYNGSDKKLVLVAFQFTAILQWLAFYLMSAVVADK